MIPVSPANRYHQELMTCKRCGHKPELGETVHRCRSRYNGSTYYCQKCKEEMEYDFPD